MEDSAEPLRTSEAIHVHIIRAKNLRGSKGEALTSYAKVELDGKTLGESSKIDSGTDESADYNFLTSFDCSLTDGNFGLDEVASKPVLVTLIEVLPKEKKQKEEKVAVLGQFTIDLLPLLSQQDLEISSTLVVHPTAGSPLDNTDFPRVEVDVSISVNEALLDGDLISQSNILTITLGSAYSIPEAWNASGQHNYVAGLPVPRAEGKDPSIIFPNGSYTLASSKESSQRCLKWPTAPNAAGNAVFIPNSQAERLPFSEERGEMRGAEYVQFRKQAENEKNRVSWDLQRRCFLDPEVKNNFRTAIGQTHLWPVEVMRTVPKSGGGSKKDRGQTDDEISYHGIAYVDLSPLLYPGVCTVSGAFRIQPFNEQELEMKTKRKGTMVNALTRVQSSTSRATGASPSQKGGGKGSSQAGTIPPSKRNSAAKQMDSSGELGDTSNNDEAIAYTKAETYIYMEFSLARPLIQKRQPEELARLVSEYIPPRPNVSVSVCGADQAVKVYHQNVSAVASMVLDEFRNLFGEDLADGSLESSELGKLKRKKQLLEQLRSSGKYFSFKEQLKHSVVNIVREKCINTSVAGKPVKPDEQPFYATNTFNSNLNVFMVDEMQSCLTKFLKTNNPYEKSIDPEIEMDLNQLKQCAQEAEASGDIDMALKFYKNRIVKDKKNPGHWLDYGTFNMFLGHNSKAKECFKESISLNPVFHEGLLMYAIMCAMDANFSEAGDILARVTSIPPNEGDNVAATLPLIIMAIFHEMQGDEISAEEALVNALAIEDARSLEAAPAVSNNDGGEEIEGSKEQPDSAVTTTTSDEATATDEEISDIEPAETPSAPSIFLKAANWLLDRKALKFAEIALARELLWGGETASYLTTLARMQMIKKDYETALVTLNKATATDPKQLEAWALLGHIYYLRGSLPEAKECYELTLSSAAISAAEMHTVYLRLGSIYHHNEKFDHAKRTYLSACEHSPTSVAWLGVGMACYRQGNLEEATDALAEANILNNENPDVWAYLALVWSRTGKFDEAKGALKNVYAHGCQDIELLKELEESMDLIT